jgi:putative transposase
VSVLTVTVGFVQRAFKFRLYPTSKQHDALGLMCAAHAELYNAGLQERRDAWAMRKTSIGVSSQMLQLKEIRTLRPDQAVWSFTSQQQTLRRLDKAFAAFFRRVKAGDTPGYPRFRAASRFDSVDFRHGDGIKFLPATKRLKIQGVGHVQIRLHRNLPEDAVLGQVSVKREGSGRRTRWFVVIPVEVALEPLPMTGAVTGIDMGVVSFLTTSEGVHIPNPRHLKALAGNLAAAQRDLAGKKRGSNRRRKAVARVAALHGTVRRQRLDHAHKTALRLVQDHDLICHEALQILNMTRRAKPVPDPENEGQFLPNGQAAKTGLNKSILDAGWVVFLSVLTAKAENAGRELISVNPANTSRTCPQCGHCAKENRPSQAVFTCQRCQFTGHADTVGAINILRAGTALRQTAHAA